jgi:hypothetical protein
MFGVRYVSSILGRRPIYRPILQTQAGIEERRMGGSAQPRAADVGLENGTWLKNVSVT